MYFALQMHWDNRRTYGSTVRASPPADDIVEAREWRDTEPARKREKAKRWIIGIENEKLIAALGPGAGEARSRVNKLTRVIETMDSPLRVDMGRAALVTCPDETEILMAAIDDVTARRERHHHSRRLRAHWAAQLLIRASHLAGEALSTGDKWPCTWTNPISTEAGRIVGRGRRHEQLGLLRWRSAKQRWPRANERVAYWWSRHDQSPLTVRTNPARETGIGPANARAAGSGL